jgi:type IV pilus assembly protein PilM
MVPASDAIWAIELGNNSLRALHLAVAGNVVKVLGFDNIQHGKVLTGAGVKVAERDELIAISLREFVQRSDVRGENIIISVPSQNSFARFVNLPPVEPKRIPEIVKFEAVQQIPFDINEVQWDWQLVTDIDSPEKKVAIFAIKNEVVNSTLEHFSREDIQVGYVQMAPMALYNYLLYDRPDLVNSNERAVVILDIGAENTDLVVCTKSIVWQRCIVMGGNTFTKAIADAFKLTFEKAEKLKRTAPVSKYARQIFQAMKPVFTDLASEVQRSLGFYTSSHANVKFTKVIALGGGTKMRGLLKYLQQTLQVPVERPDSFKRLVMGPGVSAAKFHENVCDFGVVYGLGLQALGLAKIESNLLPRSVARSMAWASKGKYFIAAACMLLAVSIMCLARVGMDKVGYAKNNQLRQRIVGVIHAAEDANNKLRSEQDKSSVYQAAMQKEFELFKYRDVIPLLHEVILSVLPNGQNNTEQKGLYEAFAEGDVEAVLEIPRKKRKQLFVTSMSAYFSDDLENAQFGKTAMMRRGSGSATDELGELSGYEYEQRMLEMEMMRQYRGAAGYSPLLKAGDEADKDAGFVVTIAGYSPYEDIGELLDPIGVAEDPNQWGFVTRLLHLDEIVDGNSPFSLYKKTDTAHFKLEKGQVDLDADMPNGIGVLKAVETTVGKPGLQDNKWVLIDPMTKEVISRVPELDMYGKEKVNRKGEPVYEINDHWFVLNAKFVWNDAPKQESQRPGILDVRGARPSRGRSGGVGSSRSSTRMETIE